MNDKDQSFFRRIGKAKTYVVLNTFYAYFSQGVAVILLGAVLPALKNYYQISYQVSGMLMSVTFLGYAVFGLLAGYMPRYFGLKRSFMLVVAALSIGMGLLLVSGNPVVLLAAMFIVGIDKGGVTTYNNQIVSVYSGGDAGPLNLLHAAFATGACIAPIIVLAAQGFDSTGWKAAVLISVVIAALGLVFMAPMKLDNSIYEKKPSRETGNQNSSFGFFKEKLFIVSLTMAFLYQFIEGTVMSWITTYFIDSDVMTDASAQIVTSVLWISLLAGRTLCSMISRRMKTQHMLLLMGACQVLFLILLVGSRSFLTMMIATVGVGLGMSGMYGTTVSNAGDVFSRYPTSMGWWVLISSLGAVISPSLVGIIANASGMRAGFVSLAAAAALLLFMAIYNQRVKEGAGRIGRKAAGRASA